MRVGCTRVGDWNSGNNGSPISIAQDLVNSTPFSHIFAPIEGVTHHLPCVNPAVCPLEICCPVRLIRDLRRRPMVMIYESCTHPVHIHISLIYSVCKEVKKRLVPTWLSLDDLWRTATMNPPHPITISKLVPSVPIPTCVFWS